MGINFRKTTIDTLLFGKAPIGFSVGGWAVSESFSAPVRLESPKGSTYIPYRRTCVADDGLEAVLDYKVYDDAIEFVLTLYNRAETASRTIDAIHFCDCTLSSPAPYTGTVRHSRVLYAKGSDAAAEDFAPLEQHLNWGRLSLDGHTARSSSLFMPYFNMDFSNGTGAFACIGWSGRWTAEIYAVGRDIKVQFGMRQASFVLEAGESVRMPSALILPWEMTCSSRELPEAFNLFRRFMKEQIMPKPGGKEFDIPVCMRTWGGVDETGHMARLENIRKHNMKADLYGMDAGWYRVTEEMKANDWFRTAGDWVESPELYPHGIRALSDRAASLGMDFWLWVEFERAVAASEAFGVHPDFYLHSARSPHHHMIDFGNPKARSFILERVIRLVETLDIKVFRIDYNVDPAYLFDQCDAPNRQGMTELRYYNGLYAFFEELLTACPNLIIDNCAGGGRRLDYRMCRYSFPIMCSSDYFTFQDYAPEGIQAHTWGLFRWIPISGDSCGSCTGHTDILLDTYRVRSSLRSSIGLPAPARELTEEEGQWFRRMTEDAQRVAPYMSLDQYPLTGYTLSDLDWMAFERCAPDGCRGLIMAFRRANAPDNTRRFSLMGLDPRMRYVLEDIDEGVIGTFTGAELAKDFEIVIPEKRMARIVFFEALPDSEIS